jgi:hypothetical protein
MIVKNDATTRVSKLAGRKQVHGKARNMRNIIKRKKLKECPD